jgi:hypothetical protein
MELMFTQRSINIPVLVGQITQKKRTILNDILSGQMNFEGITEQPNVLCFFSSLNADQFVIYPDRIAYNKLGQGELNVTRIKELFNKVFDGLLLEENVNGLLDMQAISDTAKPHTETINVFNEKFEGMLSQDEVSGVGYRFLIDNKKEQYSGEFKIEPLIRDLSKNFYQYIISMNVKLYSINELIDLFKHFEGEMALKYNSLITGLSS